MINKERKQARKEMLRALFRKMEQKKIARTMTEADMPVKPSKPLEAYDAKETSIIRRAMILQAQGRFPKVMNEWRTIERVLNGVSLSRWGDGEVKHYEGHRNVSQPFRPELQAALKDALAFRSPGYLVAIPNVFDGRQFTEVQEGYIWAMRGRFAKITDPGYEYGSSYVTRGDLFPAMHYPSFWSVMNELWKGRDVVLVRGHEKRANPEGMMAQARNISRVETPMSGAWDDYGRIFRECMAHPAQSIYLLCVGPTATVLAMELCRAGRWAVDIGHLGMFYRRFGIEDMTHRQVWNHRPGDPGYIKGVTDQE